MQSRIVSFLQNERVHWRRLLCSGLVGLVLGLLVAAGLKSSDHAATVALLHRDKDELQLQLGKARAELNFARIASVKKWLSEDRAKFEDTLANRVKGLARPGARDGQTEIDLDDDGQKIMLFWVGNKVEKAVIIGSLDGKNSAPTVKAFSAIVSIVCPEWTGVEQVQWLQKASANVTEDFTAETQHSGINISCLGMQASDGSVHFLSFESRR